MHWRTSDLSRNCKLDRTPVNTLSCILCQQKKKENFRLIKSNIGNIIYLEVSPLTVARRLLFRCSSQSPPYHDLRSKTDTRPCDHLGCSSTDSSTDPIHPQFQWSHFVHPTTAEWQKYLQELSALRAFLVREAMGRNCVLIVRWFKETNR